MKLKLLFLTICLLTLNCVVYGEGKPWENPNSGFTIPVKTTGSSGGFDKIEKIIKTDGATTVDGKTVSNAGNTKDRSFVDGFLNNAASKITGVNGTASAWSWTKSWKIGPDGKPMDVVETHQEGSLKITGSNNPKPAPSSSSSGSPSPGSSGSSSPSSPGSSVPSSSPSVSSAGSPSSPAGRPAGSPGSSGGSSSGPAKSPGASGGKTPGKTTAPQAPTPGTNIAPPKIPPAPPARVFSLFIEDQMTLKEQPFVSIENGYSTTAKPIPEDVRAKFSLDLGPSVVKERVTVKIIDDTGETAFPNGTFASPYFHIFRTPNDTDYYAEVIYDDPLTNKTDTKLHIGIPVYQLGFQNRLVDSEHARTPGSTYKANPDTSSGHSSGNFSHSSSGSSGNQSSGSGGSSGNVSPAPGSSGSSGSPGNISDIPDLSDLYKDPSSNQGPQVAGTGQGGSTGENPTGDPNSGDSAVDTANPEGITTTGDPSETPANPDETANGVPAGKGTKTGQKGGIQMAAVSSSQTGKKGTAGGGSGGGSPTGISGSKSSGKNSKAGSGTGSGGFYEVVDTSTRNGSEESAPTETGVNTGEVKNSITEKDYLINLSLYNTAKSIYQTFDFTVNSAPTAQPISQKTNLSISLDVGKTVRRETVQIVLFDGTEKVEMSLNSLPGNVIEHEFAKTTGDAYVWVYGNTEGNPFSYKVTIPVN